MRIFSAKAVRRRTAVVVAGAFVLVVAACSPAPGGGVPTTTTVPDGSTAVVTIDGEVVTVKGPAGSAVSVAVADPATLPPAPAGVLFPLGALRIDLAGVQLGSVAQVTIALQNRVDGVRKLIDGSWDAFEFDGTTGAVVSADGLTVTLYLQDGGRGDADLAVNGAIEDPVAVANVLVPSCAPIGVEPIAEVPAITPTGFGLPADTRTTVSQDGRYLFHADGAEVFRMDLDTGERSTIWDGPVFDYAVSRDGSTVAISADNRTIFWTEQAGVVRDFPTHVRLGNISDDNEYVATADALFPSGVTLLPVTGDSLIDIPGAPIFSVQFSPTLDKAAWAAPSGTSSSVLRVWDRATAVTRTIATLSRPENEITLRFAGPNQLALGGAIPSTAPATPNETIGDDLYSLDLATDSFTRIDTGIPGTTLLRIVAISPDLQRAVLSRPHWSGRATELSALLLWDAELGAVTLGEDTFGPITAYDRTWVGDRLTFSSTRLLPSGLPYRALYRATLDRTGASTWCTPPPTDFDFEPPAGTPAAPELLTSAIPPGVTVVYSHQQWGNPEYETGVNFLATSDGYGSAPDLAPVETAIGLRHLPTGRWLSYDPEMQLYRLCEPVGDSCRDLPVGTANSPKFSPDGTMIAVGLASPEPGAPSSMVVLDVETLQALHTRDDRSSSFPNFLVAWKPDSSAIAYSSTDGLATTDIVTGTKTLIATGGLFGSPIPIDWSAQGRIAYSNYGSDLRTVADDGTEDRVVLPTGSPLFGVRFLPDGRLVLSVRDKRGLATGEDTGSSPAILTDSFNPTVTWLSKLADGSSSPGGASTTTVWGVLTG